jgi:cytochrome c
VLAAGLWACACIQPGAAHAVAVEPPAPAAQQARAQGQALAAERSCLRCHDPVRRYVGPSFTEIAARYRQDAAAPARLAAKIQHGSVGEWGRVIMPRQPQVSPADAAVLARWVLSH